RRRACSQAMPLHAPCHELSLSVEETCGGASSEASLARRVSRRIQDLLPAGSRLHGTTMHSLQPLQVRDVGQVLTHSLFGRAEAFFTCDHDCLSDSLLLSLVENGQIGIGFLHGSNSSKDFCCRVAPHPEAG